MADAARPQRKKPFIWHRWAIDIVLTALVVGTLAYEMTGLRLHEWMGIVFAVFMAVHMVVNWTWMLGTTKKLVGRLPWKTRLNYLSMLLLLVALVGAVYSGLLISRAAVDELGVTIPGARAADIDYWEDIHTDCTNLVLGLVGIHVALNWTWVTATFTGRVAKPAQKALAARRQKAVAA